MKIASNRKVKKMERKQRFFIWDAWGGARADLIFEISCYVKD